MTRPVLDRIVAGEIDLVFRRWRRPTVKAGGRLRTMVGELAIHEVDVVDPAELDDDAACRSGFADAGALRASLAPRPQGASTRGRVGRPDKNSPVYRVRVSYLGADTRVALRQRLLSRGELAELLDQLEGMDARAAAGPWVFASLELIDRYPARRAPELAELLGRETAPWKAQVRRLKELGLTESLPVGYQLSPRGEQALIAARKRGLLGP